MSSALTAIFAVGLSPLARGTPATTEKARQLIRFIPAGAGNTSFHLYFLMRIPVYPRWRGEHGEKYLVSRGITGLSPLARGTHCGSERQTRHHRCIPAGAGNTAGLVPGPNILPVYPRWRGEHAFPHASRSSTGGLSPLARGTLNLFSYPGVI